MATAVREPESTERKPLFTRNVGDAERVGTTLLGAALLLGGLRRHSLFGRSAAALGSALVARGVTGHCPVYERMGRTPASAMRRALRVVESLQVGVSPGEAYAAWRDLERLPRFLRHIESVTAEGPVSHWKARFPGLPPLEWDAELIEDVPGEKISWRSVSAEDTVDNAGSVTFFDLGPRGTGLRVEIGYFPPAGPAGRLLGRLLHPVTQQFVREDVRRFKSLMEAGEIPTTQGQPSGRLTEAVR
jgi:uncharacterized membrane protein